MSRVLWLSESEVLPLVGMVDALPLVREAFEALAEGRAEMPAKVYLDFKEFQGDLRFMPAVLRPRDGNSVAGVKVVNSHALNVQRGLPTVTALLLLNDPKTGLPLAVMSAGALTGLRTGAAGGLAAKLMARPESSVIGVVGCGRQAATQLDALLRLFRVQEVRAVGATLQETQQFCSQQRTADGPNYVACRDPEEACHVDILVTTTPSRTPVVRNNWVKSGTHINAIGADAPGKQELEGTLVSRARVFVDSEEQAFHSGEVNVPLSNGLIAPIDIVGNFAEVVSGKKRGRLSPEDITVFDSTGLAVQDVALGMFVYEKALSQGKGTWMEL